MMKKGEIKLAYKTNLITETQAISELKKLGIKTDTEARQYLNSR